MELIKFVTIVDTSIYINPDQVLTVRSYAENGDETNITQIQTVSVSITVKEPLNAVVDKLTGRHPKGIDMMISQRSELCTGGELCRIESTPGPSEARQPPCKLSA